MHPTRKTVSVKGKSSRIGEEREVYLSQTETMRAKMVAEMGLRIKAKAHRARGKKHSGLGGNARGQQISLLFLAGRVVGG